MQSQQSQVSLADVHPYPIQTIVPETIEPVTTLQQPDTPFQYVEEPVEPTIDQPNAELNRAIIDFAESETGQYTTNVIDVPETVSPSDPLPPQPLIPIDTNVEFEQQPHNETPPQSSAPTMQPIEPKIPISHLIASNQYPSLHHAPPPGIVQSFAPVYVNSANQQQHNATEELYSSYVNNPYNLTLRVEQNFSPSQIENDLIASSTAATVAISTTTTTMPSPAPTLPTSGGPLIEPLSGVNEQMMAATNMNIFQSAAYFGAQSDASIPPGSEMLFGQP